MANNKSVIIYNNQIKNKNYQLFETCKFIAKKATPFLNINKFNLKELKIIVLIKIPKYVYNYMTSKK